MVITGGKLAGKTLTAQESTKPAVISAAVMEKLQSMRTAQAGMNMPVLESPFSGNKIYYYLGGALILIVLIFFALKK